MFRTNAKSSFVKYMLDVLVLTLFSSQNVSDLIYKI